MYHITFPARSRAASWAFIGEITDLDDNPLDLTGMTLEFSIMDKQGYPRMLASTADGSITILDIGVFRWFFTLAQMNCLHDETYQTGMRITTADGVQTEQFFEGPLPMISGNFVP